MAARKPPTVKPAVKTTVAKPAARSTRGTKDRVHGSPAVDEYFARQPADKRALLNELRTLVAGAVPDAAVTIKWGAPFYQRNGKDICALAAFKDHVGINFFAAPEVLVDPDGKLEGSGKGNRMLKVRRADIDAAGIKRWLKAAVTARG